MTSLIITFILTLFVASTSSVLFIAALSHIAQYIKTDNKDHLNIALVFGGVAGFTAAITLLNITSFIK